MLAAATAQAFPLIASADQDVIGDSRTFALVAAIAGLEAAGKELTRGSYLAALAGLSTVDLGGVSMVFGADDNQGMDDVFLTRITADGQLEPIVSGGGS